MRPRRAQLVTVCQQSLVTAVVLAVAASAAGVRTLDIVPTPGSTSAGVDDFAPGEADVLRERQIRATVETAPVDADVREVDVEPLAVSDRTPSKAERRAAPLPAPAPEIAAQTDGVVAPPVEDAELAAVSEPAEVAGYGTVGVTWSSQGRQYADDEIQIDIRTKSEGTWSDWSLAEYHDEHGPDGAEAERAEERPGTDAVVVGDVDLVQMRASTADGSAPEGLSLAVIDPGAGDAEQELAEIDTAELAPVPAADETTARQGQDAAEAGADTGDQTGAGTGADDTVALNAMAVAPRPQIFSRAQWGANERLRSGRPSYGTVQTGFIHHTVNANSYTEAQVPALLRGIYAYHTQSRGWSDIGYNVLVDRFGRIWEGRFGGVDKAVIGAHTLGYNEVSFAMSAIGNFETAAPPQALVNAYSRFFAWKLSLAGISASNSRIPVKGRTFQAVNGHRDAGSTACPGRYLYAKLPEIRTAAAKIQRGATPAPAPAPAPTPAPAPGALVSPTQAPTAWTKQPAIASSQSRNITGSSHADLVLKARNGDVSVLPTGGQVAFGAVPGSTGPWRGHNLITAVGDVTGDGRGDVLARNARTKVVRVHAGNGRGGFSPKGTTPTRAFRTARSITYAGDWNGDRRPDLLVVGSDTRLRVYAGKGRGAFALHRTFGTGWSSFTSIAAVGDLTNDGIGDVMGRHANGYLYLYPGVRGGGLSAGQRLQYVGGTYTAVLGGAGDLTGDGIGDVVVRNASGSVSILLGWNNGRTGEVLGPFNIGGGLRNLSMGPVTGSGHADLVGLGSNRKRLFTMPHNGLTNTTAPVSTGLNLPRTTQVFSVGDWNRDGRGDMVSREGDGDSLVLRLGRGNGTFGPAVSLGSGWDPIRALSAVGDVTGDGNPDLVGQQSANGPLVVFPGDGSDGLLAPRTLPSSMRTFQQIGTAAWAPAAARTRFPSSDGSFVPSVAGLGSALSGYDWVVGAGDLNGDGRADLVVRQDSKLWLLPGTGTGLGPRRFMTAGVTGYQYAG